MKKLLFLVTLLFIEKALHAQRNPFVYTINADSVKITNNCDTAELILENHTQNVPGFLFNKGKGRTEFRRGLYNLNDSLYLIGTDTLNISKAVDVFGGNRFFKQYGNSFGTNAVLGTRDNYPLTFIQNGNEKGRIETSGNWLFNTTIDRGYLAQFYGNIWDSGVIYQQANINIVPVGGVFGDARINIGSNTVSGNASVGIGQGVQVDGAGELAIGIGYYNTVSHGVGIMGSTNLGVAIGPATYAHRGVAIGRESVTTADNQFVSGGPDHHEPNAAWNNSIADVYFGSGIQRNSVNGAGLPYTINGSGAYGTDYAGGDITIAGGKGTGAGAPGNIIFSTAQAITTGNTLQTLVPKAMIVGNSGNFLINTITDAGFKLDVSGTGRFKTQLDVSANDDYDIRFIPDYGNVLGAGKNASVIAFGSVKAVIEVSKQNFGNIPANSMIIGGVSPDWLTTVVDYNGNPTFTTKGNGEVTIHGGYSGIRTGGTEGWSADANAFPFNIYGSRGTGSGIPGDIIFSTGNVQPSGTTIHNMTTRWLIKGGTGYLSNSPNPTSLLDLIGANGYSQLRLRSSYTPASSSDTNGNVGDVSWDDNYLYIKTSTGWKRTTLSSF